MTVLMLSDSKGCAAANQNGSNYGHKNAHLSS